MNQLLIAGADTGAITMSSREIAELTGKEHKNVLADIRVMLDDLGQTSAGFSADLPDAYGRMQPAYSLPKRECLILVAGYSTILRARIIDRWQELEAQAEKPSLVALPQDYIEALEHLLVAKKAEQLAISQRDEALRTKAMIGSKREATAMATAAAAKRESKKLKDQLGFSARHASIIAVEKATGMRFAPQDWRKLRSWCLTHGVMAETVPDARWGCAKAWPARAWLEVFKVDIAALFGEVAA